jgi:DNA-binding LacI/PurR family transcriptional regulator
VGFDPDEVRSRVAGFFSQRAGHLPTAIVGGNDTIAAACLYEARERGLAVPGQLAVSGFDNRSFSAYTSPPLTTVSMPLHEMGAAAATMLFTLIEGKPLARRRVVLPAQLIQRDSTPGGSTCQRPPL